MSDNPLTFDHWNAFRSSPGIRELAEAWVTQPRPSSTENDELLIRWFHKEPDHGLAAICAIAQMTEDPDTWDFLAAGPLEDLLCIQGEQILPAIQSLAAEHELFRRLVAGVWQLTMSKVLYQKVRAIGAGRLK